MSEPERESIIDDPKINAIIKDMVNTLSYTQLFDGEEEMTTILGDERVFECNTCYVPVRESGLDHHREFHGLQGEHMVKLAEAVEKLAQIVSRQQERIERAEGTLEVVDRAARTHTHSRFND